jgi:hypothetical protein
MTKALKQQIKEDEDLVESTEKHYHAMMPLLEYVLTASEFDPKAQKALDEYNKLRSKKNAR